MIAYYNEFDKYAADWLLNLIAAGHIAPGIVDTRSIEDVHPSDLAGFTQCHFFAGIGVWSLALRRAGWPDDRPVWTGSCPCQPFSAAGQGAGFDDKRHLWPHFHWLIQECKPSAIFGEQVASKDADPWIDLVQDDLEGLGYAFGAVAFPSAGVGAPHIRDRAYWVAHADRHGLGAVSSSGQRGNKPNPQSCGGSCDMGDTEREGLALGQRVGGVLGGTLGADAGQATERAGLHARGMADSACGRHISSLSRADQWRFHAGDGSGEGRSASGPTNGPWRDADWLRCRDGKWRPVEPGTFPLANGAPARVGRLRAYGNAINAEAARVFIESTMRAAA